MEGDMGNLIHRINTNHIQVDMQSLWEEIKIICGKKSVNINEIADETEAMPTTDPRRIYKIHGKRIAKYFYTAELSSIADILEQIDTLNSSGEYRNSFNISPLRRKSIIYNLSTNNNDYRGDLGTNLPYRK